MVGDQLLVSEMAVRPHNTGHHTIEACVTSQFEQHVRAILDLPLGSTALRAPAAAMYNIIGAADGHDQEMTCRERLGSLELTCTCTASQLDPIESLAMSRRLPIRSSGHGRSLRRLQIC